MSNYNTQLQSNNTDLQSLIDKANNLPDAGGEQATPEISVSSSGLITATAGNKSSTYQLAFQAAKTITPSTISQIAVSSGYYTGGNVTVAGDANLVAGNIKSGVSIFGVSGNYEGSGSGEAAEWSEAEDAMVTGTLTEYSNDRATTIGPYAFTRCYSLTSVSFPVCTNIGSYAFTCCYSLTTANFPVCTRINYNTFQSCSSLTSVSFPVCTNIGATAFQDCSSLTSVSFPVCTSIDANAFRYCTSLTSVSFPVCTNIGSYAFNYCPSLTSANFPKCTSIGSYAFYNCRTLSSLTLGASRVCTLSNSNALSSTPYAGYSVYFSGTPYIYVPSSLLTSYQTATNWTYFSSYFSSIESLNGGNLITFTIDETEYQAEEGMTWAQWVESEYNTGGYYVDGTNICDANGISITSDFFPATPDLIIYNAEYYGW